MCSGYRMTIYNADTLAEFVRTVDRAGGPESAEAKKIFEDFRYDRKTEIDVTLDPNSEEYWQQQIALYKELSGRELDQTQNELTEFPLEDYVGAVNAYASNDPVRISLHFCRLSKLIRLARPPNSARVLDLGCGWGLSSELFSVMGCNVTAVDINAKFANLVRARASRLGMRTQVINSSFDELSLDGLYDLIVFYESLHHAVRPSELISRVSRCLSPNGKIALAGEPIQELWWETWGLRLDPLSIYCIRKFGWFESGWSRNYVTRMLVQSGLSPSIVDDADPEIGPIVIADRKSEGSIGARTEGASPGNSSGIIKAKLNVRMALFLDGLSLIMKAISVSFLFRK